MKEKMFAFKGRMNRKNYIILSFLPILIILISAIPIMIKIFSMGNEVYDIGDTIFIPTYFGLLLSIWISLAINVKRLHDVNMSGFFVILNFIPYINILLWIFLMIIKGSNGENKYGINTDINDNKVIYRILIGIIFTFIISIIMVMPFFVKALVDTHLNMVQKELHNYGVYMNIISDNGLINNRKKIEMTIINNEMFIENIEKLISNNIPIISSSSITNYLNIIKDMNKYDIKVRINFNSNNFLLNKPKAEVFIENYYSFFTSQADIHRLEAAKPTNKNAEKDFKDKLEIYHPNIKKGIKIFDISFYFNGAVEKVNLDFEDDTFKINGLEFLNKNKKDINFKINSYKDKESTSDELIINYSKDNENIELEFSQNNFKDTNSFIENIKIKNNIKIKDFIDVNSKMIIDTASNTLMKISFEKVILEFRMSSIDRNKFDTFIKAYSRSDKKDYIDLLNYSIYNIINDGLNIKFNLVLLNTIQNKVTHKSNEISFNISLSKNKLNVENTFAEILKYIDFESEIILSKNTIQSMKSLSSDAPIKVFIDKYKNYLHLNGSEDIRLQNGKLEINGKDTGELSFKEEYKGYFFHKDRFDEKYISIICNDGLFENFAIFSIDSGKILYGNLRTKHSQEFVKEWIISNRDKLNKQWNLITNTYEPEMLILK
jgi:uncharacterized membrane protein YhaH (DUF805 family)